MTPECPPEGLGFEALRADRELADPPQRVDWGTAGEKFAKGQGGEVNLHKYAGRDSRPATVEKDNRILLLHRIGGEDQEIEMTCSEVQWSWARINQLGGMDPEDFRLWAVFNKVTGPFVRDPADRNTQEYALATPRQIYESLVSLLMSPTVQIRYDYDDKGKLAVVDVQVPGFASGQDELRVHTTLQPWWINARGQGGHAEGPQQVATPIHITELRDDKTRALIGFRYAYRLLDARRTVVRTCVQRIFEGEIAVPAPRPGEIRTELAEAIPADPDQIRGWACAGPKGIRKRP